ncbi:hypothetical protein OJAV_G00095610 [Oryzias javanicus]|uniref:LRAT domain-containing protein n=1 Tax=Oryzias javanicus TaxID=123683 RepID=A0A3S2MK98_ORYJA|nr:hypothetical protein OJAV_G00095610 [Oryzias javanicus]
MSFFASRAFIEGCKTEKDETGKEANPGDLIEIFSVAYSHWAVYIGNGFIVHFGRPGALSGSISLIGDGIVMKEKLQKVAGNNRWRVNNILDEKYTPLSPDEIVKKACSLVGASLQYNLEEYNCEHFATEMRYGKPESRQVLEVQKETFVIFAGLWLIVGIGILRALRS